MITSKQALARYGQPDIHNPCMILWDVPDFMEIGTIPKRIYCNVDLVDPLYEAFKNLITRGFVGELKTWDGCFNIRKIKGSNSLSLHSWGLAVDVNAYGNGFNSKGTLSQGFVQCFLDAGFDWGGFFKHRTDPMHFQLKNFPDS